MGKLQSFKIDGLDLFFNSNDHRPEHFHVRKSGAWEIRVYFLLCSKGKELVCDIKYPPNAQISSKEKGLSDRQVRRIEQGEGSTKIDTLRLFAKAHGMDLDAYLDAVASAINHIPKEFNPQFNVDKKEVKSIDDLRKHRGTEKQANVVLKIASNEF